MNKQEIKDLIDLIVPDANYSAEAMNVVLTELLNYSDLPKALPYSISSAMPDSSYDATKGYLPGYKICVPTTMKEYKCKSNSTGAAVWQPLTGEFEPALTAGNPDDNTIALFNANPFQYSIYGNQVRIRGQVRIDLSNDRTGDGFYIDVSNFRADNFLTEEEAYGRVNPLFLEIGLPIISGLTTNSVNDTKLILFTFESSVENGSYMFFIDTTFNLL